MNNELVKFIKTARIEQKLDAFSGCKFTLIVLVSDSFLSSTQFGFVTQFFQPLNFLIH
jgi:hypothetical protein